ncbi:hypothetical protein IQ238_13805 [Pleurocapsales cyanobacterium LEGE 06147]|nr:hypothetical protein [Pleurocapsales cyanobacterium LEGE 06147]
MSLSAISFPLAVLAQRPPLEKQQETAAAVTSTDGTVMVKLSNNTNTQISYRAIGHTENRVLLGGEEIVLRDLPVPITIVAVREDDGLLNFIVTGSESDFLEVSLNEVPSPDKSENTIRIQNDGQIFLY